MARDIKEGRETQRFRETRKKEAHERDRDKVEKQERNEPEQKYSRGDRRMDMDNVDRDSKTSRNRRGEKRKGKCQR